MEPLVLRTSEVSRMSTLLCTHVPVKNMPLTQVHIFLGWRFLFRSCFGRIFPSKIFGYFQSFFDRCVCFFWQIVFKVRLVDIAFHSFLAKTFFATWVDIISLQVFLGRFFF